jgi:hypothetical protein
MGFGGPHHNINISNVAIQARAAELNKEDFEQRSLLPYHSLRISRIAFNCESKLVMPYLVCDVMQCAYFLLLRYVKIHVLTTTKLCRIM